MLLFICPPPSCDFVSGLYPTDPLEAAFADAAAEAVNDMHILLRATFRENDAAKKVGTAVAIALP